MTKKLVLIDGHSLAYRAFYALPDTMRTSKGLVTNAVYGFTTMLMKVLEERPDYIAVTFDLRGPTFRHKEFDQYKATRQVQPPTLTDQLPLVREIVEKLKIPIFEKEGFEADDLIGTLAKRAEQEGLNVEIVTGDLDTLQLVSPKVRILATRKGITDTVIYDPKQIELRYGIKPDQVADFKALKGDPSDNIPGVKGIGEKTAASLVAQYGSLDKIYENLEHIEPARVRDALRAHQKEAFLSKRLATIICNIPIEIDWQACQRQETDWEKVIPLFEKLEFGSLLKRYAGTSGGTGLFPAKERKLEAISQANLDYRTVDTEEDLEKLANQVKKAGELAIDTETTSEHPLKASLVGISVATQPNQAFYIPVGHQRGMQLSLKTIQKILGPLLESQKIKKCGQNAIYDWEVLERHGFALSPFAFDTMIAAYLIDPVGGGIGLKALGSRYLNRQMLNIEDMIGERGKQITMADVEIPLATTYACSDADVTFQLVPLLEKQLKVMELVPLLRDVEIPLIEVIKEMETMGTYVDVERLKALSKKLTKKMNRLSEEIQLIAGESFNVDSTKQLQEILFNKLKLPIQKRTKTGISTDASVLEELAPKFEIAAKLLEYRNLTKLLSTYIDVLPTMVDPKTSRVHTSFHQTRTATGRLSSSDPNLQNIPAKGELAEEIRAAFVPEKKGWIILAADYSQIELRILAHLSGDRALTDAFQSDLDIHRATAAAVHGKPLDAVTPEERDAAKAVNFGIIYGLSEYGLSKQIGINRQEAKLFIDKYFSEHPGVKKFIDDTIAFARENGYVKTMLGRRRPLTDINSPNLNQRQYAERTAINMPVQGTAADMIKIAMIRILEKLRKKGMESKMLIQVHDELVFEAPKSEAIELQKLVDQEMQEAIPLEVPVKVATGIGPSWAEARS